MMVGVDLTALRSIMLAIAEARSVHDIFRQIVEGVAEASNVALARLWIFGKSADCPLCERHGSGGAEEAALHLVASLGRSKDRKNAWDSISGRSHRIRLGERKIGRIAEAGEALLIPDVTPDQPWVADPEWVRREAIRSFAGQPLIFRGQVLGVLALFSRERLSEDEFLWLRTFADHAAVAISNARAFDELSRLKSQLEVENAYLHDEVKDALPFGSMVGSSAAFQKVADQVSLVAETDATVLILGESGTGKELIARAIHERSPRKHRPFVKVNCGAIPEGLFESEFFGHARGAFTGAVRDRAGRFEVAHGGDIFLDEIGELPLAVQAKLLRVIQEKQFERVGETRTRTVAVRVIAATNRDLKQRVADGHFREDLYYRLSVFPIEVAPLRERKEDIPALAAHFLQKIAARMNLKTPLLTPTDLQLLARYDWPGNVRELENILERAVILSRNSAGLRLDAALLGNSSTRPPRNRILNSRSSAEAVLTREEMRRQERQNILAALERSGGKVFGTGGAAELLGIPATTLASRIKSLGIQKRFVAAN